MQASPAKKGVNASSTVETYQSWKSAQDGTSYALRNAFKNDKWLARSMKEEERILLKFEHSSAFNAAMEAAENHHNDHVPVAKAKPLIPKRKKKKTKEEEYATEIDYYLEQAEAWAKNQFENEEEASSDDAKDAEYGDK